MNASVSNVVTYEISLPSLAGSKAARNGVFPQILGINIVQFDPTDIRQGPKVQITMGLPQLVDARANNSQITPQVQTQSGPQQPPALNRKQNTETPDPVQTLSKPQKLPKLKLTINSSTDRTVPDEVAPLASAIPPAVMPINPPAADNGYTYTRSGRKTSLRTVQKARRGRKSTTRANFGVGRGKGARRRRNKAAAPVLDSNDYHDISYGNVATTEGANIASDLLEQVPESEREKSKIHTSLGVKPGSWADLFGKDSCAIVRPLNTRHRSLSPATTIPGVSETLPQFAELAKISSVVRP